MSPRRRWIFGIVAALIFIVGAGTALTILGGSGRDPAKSAAYLRLGNAALTARSTDEARGLFRKAVKADKKNKDAHYALGYVLQVYDAKPVDAEAEYRKAIDIDPGFTSALYSLAVVRAGAMDPEEAVALYRRVIQIDPNYAEAHFNLGLLLRDDGQRSAGDAEIAKGISLKPSLGERFATTTTEVRRKKK